MTNNWIILDNGTLRGITVNLDGGLTVLYGGDIVNATDPQKLTVFFYQSVQNKGLNPSYQACKFSSANLAIAFYNRVITLMIKLGYIAAGSDLRSVTVGGSTSSGTAKLASIQPNNYAAGADQIITLTGTGLSATGKITIGGTDYPITVAGGAAQFTFPGTAIAGTYTVEYTDPQGNAAVLTNGLTLT